METALLETAPSFATADDTHLIAGLLADHPQAWSEFTRRFGRLIDGCIRRVLTRFTFVGSDEDVREVNARLCVQLLSNDKYRLRSYKQERGTKFSTWLGMLSTHAAYDYLRAHRREPMMETLNWDAAEESTPSPFDACAAREEANALTELLAGFSAKDRQFVILYFGEGLSPEDVAREMGISVKTVYSKKHKIRARLAELGARCRVAA